MDRRCTTDSCMIKANRKVSLDMPVANIMVDPRREWTAVATGSNRVRVARKIDVNWDDFNNDNYLFSHCSIVSSVNVEQDPKKPGNGYYIDPICSSLINNNGNAWTTPVLLSTFNTFRGAENYLEHVQIPELSKGKILDAVARPVKYACDNGAIADVYYIDILVATNRRHGSLVRDISGGKLTTMSMGCIANYVQCSKCGTVMSDNEPNCPCIANELLQEFRDENGVTRVVAELCGRHLVDQNGKLLRDASGNLLGDPESVKFIEASWVDKPAFTGAVLNHYISDIGKEAAKVLDFGTVMLEQTVEDIFRMRVADKRGMQVLRVAKAELMRRQREDMINRVAGSVWH